MGNLSDILLADCLGLATEQEDDSLSKAIQDLGAGVKTHLLSEHNTPLYDYSHLLPEEAKQQGYGLMLEHHNSGVNGEQRPYVYAHLSRHGDLGKGNVFGYIPKEGGLKISGAEIYQAHKGKGLGLPMYEGLISYAKQHLGADRVLGDAHSSSASAVHKKLAKKHGLAYKAKPNIKNPNEIDTYRNYDDWAETPPAPYDYKYAKYNYALKSEDLEKGLKGDWTKEGYEIRHQLDPNGKTVNITAHLGDKLIGDLDAGHSESQPGTLHPGMVNILPEHRRKGLATAMYQRAEQVLGAPFHRGAYQSEEAKKLWAQPNRPFGKSESLDKAILDPGLGYKFSHEHHEVSPGQHMTKVNVHSPIGEHVGAATFMHQGQNLVPGTVAVDEDHQRRGIGSAMYSHAQRSTGKTVIPSSNQTPEGAALWHGNAAKQQFGATPKPLFTAPVKSPAMPAAPHLHSTVEGFMGGLKALPKGSSERGKFITSHMNNPGFLGALKADPQGAQIHSMLTSHLNSASNAGFKQGSTVATAKSEDGDDLEKGAMSRLAPFNPQDPKQRLDPQDERSLSRWQGTLREPEDRAAGDMANAPRMRALHHIASKTKVRTNQQTGEREYLLHRGMGPEERSKTLTSNGTVNHTEPSSWTPDYGVAMSFAQDYHPEHGTMKYRPENTKPVSGWVPESSIYMVPKQYGRLKIPTLSAQMGPNAFNDEHEVLVEPDHNSKLASDEDVIDKVSPLKTLNGRINYAGAQNKQLGPIEATGARLSRVQHLKMRNAVKSEDIEDWLTKNEHKSHAASMCGSADQIWRAVNAAKVLGEKTATIEEVKQAIKLHGYDIIKGTLVAHGLEPTEDNVKHLKAIMEHSSLGKSEEELPKVAYALTSDGTVAADAVNQSIEDQTIEPLQLKGKHSKGSLRAVATDGANYIIKPNAGGTSPAQGVAEEPANSARREAAFWQVARLLGLGVWFPRADLIQVDGHEAAALVMLGYHWKNYGDWAEDNQGVALRVLERYRKAGLLTQWGVIDYICGNADRHQNNAMCHDVDVMLIDQGSAFAGKDFDPAHDKNSFVPFYLRAWATNWSELSPKHQLESMPRCGKEREEVVSKWVSDIDEQMIAQILQEYGIDTAPTLDRIKRVKSHGSTPIDLWVNNLWISS